VVRLEVAKHLQEIHHLFSLAYRSEASLIGVAPDRFPPLNRTQADLLASSGWFLGTFKGTQLVGVLEWEETAPEALQIVSLAVLPSMVLQGIGSLLVKQLLAIDNKRVGVTTAAANQPARRLYEKSGLVLTREFETHDQVLMVEYACNR